MANKIQLRRDTAANWNRINPILADGEPGLDITTNKIKMGDGTTEWADLPYLTVDEHTRLVNDNAVVTLDSTGVLNIPGTINSSTGITMTSGRGAVEFGVNLEAPGIASHFHINKTSATSSTTDLFFGDDTNYLKLPSNGGVVIGADGTLNWSFDVNGTLTIPDNGIISSTTGTDGTSLNISNITVDSGNGFRVTVTTSVPHGITQNGTKVFITGLTRCTQLNDFSYYVVPNAVDTFYLFTDVDYNVVYDGSAITEPYSTTGNRATTYSGTQTTTDTSPLLGESVIGFYGNSYIRVAPSNDFDFNVGPFSVSFWAYQTSYAGNPRIFTFGSWPTETLGMSSENSGTTYTWLNGQNIGDGLGGLSLNTWHHVVITRFENTMRICIDGTVGNSFPGISYDLYMAATKTLTIGNDGVGGAGFSGYIRDFKINVGQGIDTSTLTVPTAAATVDSPYTKLLLLASPSDSSGSAPVTGGGTVTEKIPGGDVVLAAAESINGSDFSNVTLSAGYAALKVDGKRNVVTVSTPGSDHPINGSGQDTITINASSETNPIDTTTTISWLNNVWYVCPETGYSPTGTHIIIVPVAERVGVEVTIINDTEAALTIANWDGPFTGMVAFESIKLVSYKDDFGQMWWWQTGAYAW
jgi:hypothetical protein